MREKFTRNIFLIVRPSYIRATIARLCLCVYMWHPPSPPRRRLPLGYSSPSPLFPSLRHYLHETRKRPIRLTYVAARLLLQRSLQSQFWHSYSRVRIFMIMPVKYTTVEEGRTDRREIDRVLDEEEDHSSAVQPPLRLPFEGTFERIYICYVYRHTNPYVTSRLHLRGKLALSWPTSVLRFPADFYAADEHGCRFKRHEAKRVTRVITVVMWQTTMWLSVINTMWNMYKRV